VATDQHVELAQVRSIQPALPEDEHPPGALPLAPDADLVFAVFADLAAATVPAAAGAGICLIRPGVGRSTCAATGPLVTAAEALQDRNDGGPSRSAWSSGEAVRVPDVRGDPRWPGWATEVAALGVRAATSVPLVAGPGAFGALTVYATAPAAFDERDDRLLGLLASAVAVLTTGRPLEDAGVLGDRTRDALHDRDAISTAKGVLMARHGVDDDTALRLLLEASRQSGTRLRDVAQDVVRAAVRQRR
jgi:GAF domain-containing protein